MKKILSLALALALMAALFTGCGCEANVSTHPGGMITEEPAVRPHPTATHATEPKETQNTMPTVTGSDPTDEGAMPNSGGGSNGTNGGTGSGGSNGSNGGTGTGESTTPTDATVDPRARSRNTIR